MGIDVFLLFLLNTGVFSRIIVIFAAKKVKDLWEI